MTNTNKQETTATWIAFAGAALFLVSFIDWLNVDINFALSNISKLF